MSARDQPLHGRVYQPGGLGAEERTLNEQNALSGNRFARGPGTAVAAVGVRAPWVSTMHICNDGPSRQVPNQKNLARSRRILTSVKN